MTLQNVIYALDTVKNGWMTRLAYNTELPVKAEYKKKGIKVIKHTSVTVRIGVDYEHIQAVIDAKKYSSETVKKAVKTAYSWIIRNRISYNDNTGKYYLRVATLPQGSNPSFYYTLIEEVGCSIFVKNVSVDDIKDYVVNSYWCSNTPIVQNISIDNIVSINGVI